MNVVKLNSWHIDKFYNSLDSGAVEQVNKQGLGALLHPGYTKKLSFIFTADSYSIRIALVYGLFKKRA